MRKVFYSILVALSVLAILAGCKKEPQTISVTGITLDKSSVELTEGETATLSATIAPSNATNANYSWSSSDAAVASVNNGTVTAVKAGKATITVKSEDGGKTATCAVTVNAKIIDVTGVTLDKSEASMLVGQSLTLVATIAPADATNKNVSWASSDETIATVDATGKVTAVKQGECTITVTTEDGKKTAQCKISVTGVKADNPFGDNTEEDR